MGWLHHAVFLFGHNKVNHLFPVLVQISVAVEVVLLFWRVCEGQTCWSWVVGVAHKIIDGHAEFGGD